jgi:hypothetical protein
MSIVVTCSCEMTYRLPDRYAGKRCRCRECGGAIKIPRAGEEVPVKSRKTKAKKRRKKAKAASEDRRRAQRTTRRLSSQEQEILGDRRALRRAYTGRPVSESMHQIAPLTLSGTVERPRTLGPATRRKKEAVDDRPRKRRRKRAREDQRSTKGRNREEKQRSPKKKKALDAPKTKSKGKSKPNSEKATAPQRKKKGKELPSKGAKLGRLERGRGRAALAARPRGRGAQAGRRALGRRAEEDGETAVVSPRRNSRTVLLGVIAVAALCLLVGWAFGVGLSGASGSGVAVAAGLDSQLAEVEELKKHRQWSFAREKLQALEAQARLDGDEAAVLRIRDLFVAVDMMVQLSDIEDDETKLATLVTYADHEDPTVRLGIAMELRGLGQDYDAQETLSRLAGDPDPQVQAAARQGLIAAGGPFSIPYLAEAIESSAATGGKLGEQALERALELYEPEIVPVLVKALELRKSAPAPVLVAILNHLHELGEPSAVEAASGFTSHADEKVKAAAQRVVDDLS